jgi:hypothetical protein
VHEDDALMLWLRADELQLLPDQPPTKHLMLSGMLGGLEAAPLPAAWQQIAIETYPVEMPAGRQNRMTAPLAWFNLQQIKLVDQRTQVDTYLSCVMLADVIRNMLGNYAREYLVERFEEMVSQRLASGYYPRLSLAPGQRFASKGGYLVRWIDKVPVAEGDWLVPQP